MIGNDIACIDKYYRTQDRLDRVMSKTCTKLERYIILSSFSSFRTFVLIWTLKESAFKAEQRINHLFQFIPSLISSEIEMGQLFCSNFPEQTIDLNNDGYAIRSIENINIAGTVKTPFSTWATSSLITKTFIHTISYPPDIEKNTICWGIKRTDNLDYRRYSKELRDFASSCISQNIELPREKKSINWVKSNLPEFQISGNNIAVPISFSHDTPFLSFAYLDNLHQ